MKRDQYLSASFVVGVSLLGATCLGLVMLILLGCIPWKEAVEPLGGVAAAAIGLLGAALAAYLAHRQKVQHDRRSMAKALAGEVAAIRTWLFNACGNPPNWNAMSGDQIAWYNAVQSLRPPPLTVYGPKVFTAIGSLDHTTVFKFVEFRGNCEALSRMIDNLANLDPSHALVRIDTLMNLLDTVGRQADGVAVSLATNFDIRLSFEASWPSDAPPDQS